MNSALLVDKAAAVRSVAAFLLPSLELLIGNGFVSEVCSGAQGEWGV